MLANEAQPHLSEYEISASAAKITLVFPDPLSIDTFLETTNQYGFRSVVVDSLEKETGAYKMKIDITK